MIKNKRPWAVGATEVETSTPKGKPRTKPTDIAMDYSTRNAKPDLTPDDYVTRGGQKFPRLSAFLKMANYLGLEEIDTHLVKDGLDGDSPVVVYKAVVTVNGRKFSGHGDATLNNVGATVKQHFNRMAETRAIVRALRWATGIYDTAAEELDGNDPARSIGNVTHVSARAKTSKGEL